MVLFVISRGGVERNASKKRSALAKEIPCPVRVIASRRDQIARDQNEVQRGIELRLGMTNGPWHDALFNHLLVLARVGVVQLHV